MGKPRMTELEMAEAELAASERWRHDTALERDYEVQRRKAAEAEAYAHKRARAELNELCTQYRARAEAAEAEARRLDEVARTMAAELVDAEARIAAVLSYGRYLPPEVIRVLTGDDNG